MNDERSRYAVVSRRALLRRGAGLGAIALLPGLACGGDDESVLAGARADSASGATSQAETPTAIAPSPTAAPEPTQSVESDTDAEAPEPTTPPAAAATTALAAGTEAVISFTYTQGEGGKNLPPYVAVWIEDAAGDLIATVALWYQLQPVTGEKWLPDLKRWFSVDQDRLDGGGEPQVDLISSATRLPGSFSVMWDGATHDGQIAPPGEHFVCIESSRERGPYSLIREPVTFAADAITLELGAEGELSAASITTSV